MINNLTKYLSDEEFNYISNENDLYLKSKMLVEILFLDKFDKNNKPYINHLLRVSNNMTTLDGKVAALLHDVVEDIENVTFGDLIDIGIPNNIIEILKLVTNKLHKEGLNNEEKLILYNEEIDNIINSNNELAIELKYSDMSDNFNKDRLSELDEDMKNWLTKKYENNIKKLEKRMENRNDRY